MYSGNPNQEGGIILKLVEAFLVRVERVLWLVQLHVDLPEIQKHVYGAEVLKSRLELSLSITIQSQSRGTNKISIKILALYWLWALKTSYLLLNCQLNIAVIYRKPFSRVNKCILSFEIEQSKHKL